MHINQKLQAGTAEPIALYVHWPFCRRKCPYCDFNSHVRESIDAPRFTAALLAELRFEAARLGPRPLASLFFGGGTPSLMPPDTVAALIAAAQTLFPPTPHLEITLEANPTSVERARLTAFRQAGINRLSLGIQALNDDALRFLGREHTAADAIAALELARATFPRLSFDLIYGRPSQTLAAWRAELHRALVLAADHLSLYQLTIEPGTAFEAPYRQGAFTLPAEAAAARLYAATEEAAARHGLAHYEISNYAAPGAESRHNLAYWTYADTIGIGAGAHGRVPIGGALHATTRHRAPEIWLDQVERHGHASRQEPLDPLTRAREMLLMGLRLTAGMDRARFHARTGMALEDALDTPTFAAAIDAGYLEASATTLRATGAGRLRLDALLPRLLR